MPVGGGARWQFFIQFIRVYIYINMYMSIYIYIYMYVHIDSTQGFGFFLIVACRGVQQQVIARSPKVLKYCPRSPTVSWGPGNGFTVSVQGSKNRNSAYFSNLGHKAYSNPGVDSV